MDKVQGYQPTTLIQHCMGGTSQYREAKQAGKTPKNVKARKCGKEEVKLILFADNKVMYRKS